MSQSLIDKEQIKTVIKESLRKKLKNYKPETNSMPFHFRLLGKDRMALFSFIHSLNTTFGTSIFEPVAEVVAKSRFPKVEKQFQVGDRISENAQTEIQNIINELTTSAKLPNKIDEIKRIRSVYNKGNINKMKIVKVDLLLEDASGCIHLFDIKTAKPNIGEFVHYKRNLLEWIAIYFLEKNPNAVVNSYIAIPYNPYEPKPYERWTLKGMLDLKLELKVADEFWDFLGGKGTYNFLLECFEEAGIELRTEIDEYFSKFV